MSDKVFLGTRMAQLDTSPALAPVSKVILAVDSENAYIAGDDTGRTIEVTCPYGTQEMANNILAALSSYTYTPAMAQGAILDPAAEIGDGLTMGGVYTVLAQSTLTFDGLMTSDAGAPGQAEQESEYKYQSPVIADINWQLAQTNSLITKTSEEIRLMVQNEIDGLESSITVTLDGITQRVDGLDGQYTELKTTVDGVTVTDSTGTTKIRGSSIETDTLYVNAANITGTLTASQIDASNLKVNAANITGTLTIGQLPSTVAETSDIPTSTSQLWNDSGYQNATGVVSIVNGTVTADYVNALSVQARYLKGQIVSLLASSGTEVGSLNITYTTTGDGVVLKSSSGGTCVQSDYGNISLEASSANGAGAFITVGADHTIGMGGTVLFNTYNFGSSLPAGVYGQVFFLF